MDNVKVQDNPDQSKENPSIKEKEEANEKSSKYNEDLVEPRPLNDLESIKQRITDIEVAIVSLKHSLRGDGRSNFVYAGASQRFYQGFRSEPLKVNRKVECKTCSVSFTRIFELEKHLGQHHKSLPRFKCDTCGKEFLLKWRLEKHQDNHMDPERKKCHYFNNNKKCPYEELGCMFVHEKSEKCKFDDICANRLCPFRHSSNESKRELASEKTAVINGDKEI